MRCRILVDVDVDGGTAEEAALAIASAPVSYQLPGGGTMFVFRAVEHKEYIPEIRELPGRSTGVSRRRDG